MKNSWHIGERAHDSFMDLWHFGSENKHVLERIKGVQQSDYKREKETISKKTRKQSICCGTKTSRFHRKRKGI